MDNSLQLDDNTLSHADQYLTFMMANQEYAFHILHVLEIRGYEESTTIPDCPAFVRGILNLRGTIVPVIDLREFFKLEKQAYDRNTVVIVLQFDLDETHFTVGLVVDQISEVYDISSDNIRMTPETCRMHGAAMIKGMAMLDKKVIIVLDINKIFSQNLTEALQAFTMHSGIDPA